MGMDADREIRLLKELIFLHERSLSVAEQTAVISADILCVLRQMEHRLFPKVQSFIIRRLDMIALAPGNSPVFTATPVPEGSQVPAGTSPSWTCSDQTFTITLDTTGLVATVAIPATATVGAEVTLTITITRTDGQVATGSTTFAIVAAPAGEPTSFTIAQTA